MVRKQVLTTLSWMDEWSVYCVLWQIVLRAKCSVEASEVETYAVARANFIVQFNVYWGISDSETFDNSRFLQQSIQCNV